MVLKCFLSFLNDSLFLLTTNIISSFKNLTKTKNKAGA